MKKSFFVPEHQRYIKLVEGYLNIYNTNNELASTLISPTREVIISNNSIEKKVDASQFLFQRYLKVELLAIHCLKEYEAQKGVSLGLDYSQISKILSYSHDFLLQKYSFKYPVFSKSEFAIEPSEINFSELKRLKVDLEEYNDCVKKLKKALSKHKSLLDWKISLPQESMFNSWKTIDLTFGELVSCYKTLEFDSVGRGAVKFALESGPEYFIQGGTDIKELSKEDEGQRYVVFVNNRFVPNNRLELEKGLEATISTAKTFSTLESAQKLAIRYAYKGEYAIIKIQTKALEVCINTLASTGDTKNVVSSIETKTEKKHLNQELTTFDTEQEIARLKTLVANYQSVLETNGIEDSVLNTAPSINPKETKKNKI